jgi:hypothetical protein
MLYTKLTYGCVAQTIDSETGDCVSQTFIADGRIDRQSESGEPIPEDDAVELVNVEKDCPLDMVQP